MVQLVCLCGRRGEEKVVCFLSDFFFLFGHLFCSGAGFS